MSGNVRGWATLLLLGLAGCFHSVEDLSAQHGLPQVVSYAVVDALGATWPSMDAPRSPSFELRLEDEVPAKRTAALPLYLVRGPASEDVLEDLGNPPLRAATLAALEPVSVVSNGRQISATPQAKKLPVGQAFTLVWAAATSQVFSVLISEDPAAGAQWVESFPASDSRAVPTNLRQAFVRFDGHLEVPLTAQLEAPGQRSHSVSVEVASCKQLGFTEGDCLWLSWSRDLVPQTEYSLVFSESFRDVTGSNIDAPPLRFETSSTPDTTAPQRSALPCAIDETAMSGLCVFTSDTTLSLRAMFDEPAFVELIGPPHRSSALSFSDAVTTSLTGLTEHHCSLLRVTDLAGNRSEDPVCVGLHEGLLPVTIDEVLVNPRGPDTTQEFVELLNFGDEPVILDGLTLSQDAFSEGQSLSLLGALIPGERVLVVGPGFDRRNEADERAADSVRLVRLARPLSLANEGAPLFLRDRKGRRLAASPRVRPNREGQSIVRRETAAPRSGLASDFTLDPNGSSTPGRPTFETGKAPP